MTKHWPTSFEFLFESTHVGVVDGRFHTSIKTNIFALLKVEIGECNIDIFCS